MDTLMLHAFHHELISHVYSMSLKDRIHDIKTTKPPHEQAIRMKLIHEIIPEDLPSQLREAYKSWRKALQNWYEHETEKTFEKQDMAWGNWCKIQCSLQAREWHSKICGCTEWDWERNEIVFPEEIPEEE